MKMKQLPLCVASAIALLCGITACDNSDDLSMPGSALVEDRFTVVVNDNFKIESKSVLNPRVQSRTTTQLLGIIEAPKYGVLHADYMAQLFPTTNIDTVGVEIDSVKLQMVFDKNGFVGDSLAPIGFEVYPLTVSLPYPIYSNFPDDTPYADGNFYNPTPTPDECSGRGIFTGVGSSISDEVAGSAYRFAYANLPKAFGQKIFNAFKNPETRPLFSNPEEFADKIFPGVYVKTTFGSGRVTRITDTRIMVYYTKTERLPNSAGVMIDSVRHMYTYYMATAPEVVSNTNISMEMSDAINEMVENGRSVILSPAGRDVELNFPIVDIIETYRNNVGSSLSMINTMNFAIPCDSIANGRGINPPAYLLMVLSKDKDKFFAANKLPDDVTSFVATFNKSTMAYDFGNMRSYLMKMMEKGTNNIKADDYTFTITPVSMVSESSSSYYSSGGSSTLSGMSPMVAMPAMVELLPEKGKVTLTFSKQDIK